MSKESDAVKRWRHNCKRRVITAMGGACCICGYNKCQSALALHHLDPNEKDFNFGAIRANPKNWDALVIELRKCVLLCHNCHSEVHEGISVVPHKAPRFDESYTNYQDVNWGEEILTPCPVCQKLKPDYLINCSLECAGKAARKVDWDNIDLIKELETKSFVQIAEELNCSDGAVHKRYKKILDGNYESRKKNPSIIKNCAYCQKEITVFASQDTESNYCNKDCRTNHQNKLADAEWIADDDLLKMQEAMSVKEIATKLGKSFQSVYRRLDKINKKNSE